jgi:peptidyl-prolyl cis-trans isomerase C
MKKNTKIKNTLLSFGLISGILALSFVVNAAEKKISEIDSKTKAPITISKSDKDKPLLKINNIVVTVKDIEDKINKKIPFIRKRFKSKEKIKEFLNQYLAWELFALEARSKGLDKHKNVTSALRRILISRQKNKVLESRVTLDSITKNEVEKYYKSHLREFKRPERRRPAVIVVKTKEKASEIIKTIESSKGKLRKFQKMVGKFSIDPYSKKRNGFLPFIDAESTKIEKAIIDTVFKMKKSGKISKPVKVKNGWAIIRLSGIGAKIDKSVDAVTLIIKKRLISKKREIEERKYLLELRKNAKIKIYKDKLSLITVNTKSGYGRAFHNPSFKRKNPGYRKRDRKGKHKGHGHK